MSSAVSSSPLQRSRGKFHESAKEGKTRKRVTLTRPSVLTSFSRLPLVYIPHKCWERDSNDPPRQTLLLDYIQVATEVLVQNPKWVGCLGTLLRQLKIPPMKAWPEYAQRSQTSNLASRLRTTTTCCFPALNGSASTKRRDAPYHSRLRWLMTCHFWESLWENKREIMLIVGRRLEHFMIRIS